MDSNDDDKPTVVLDFNALKDQLNDSEELSDLEDIDELLNMPKSSDEAKNSSHITKENSFTDSSIPICLFDYQSDKLREWQASIELKFEFEVITELNDLNNKLRLNQDMLVIFYFNENPKIVNQLIPQIKNKFPKAKTLILAKSLNSNKVEAHSKTKFGAHAYLNIPCTNKEFIQTFLHLTSV